MTTELTYLVWVTALTALLSVPYITNMIGVRGIVDAVGYPSDPKPMAPWAVRMKAAHANAVENLVVFAALVLTASVAGVANPSTAMACQVYFWARVVHLVCHTAAVPWARTVAFLVGWGAQMVLVWQLLNGAG